MIITLSCWWTEKQMSSFSSWVESESEGIASRGKSSRKDGNWIHYVVQYIMYSFCNPPPPPQSKYYFMYVTFGVRLLPKEFTRWDNKVVCLVLSFTGSSYLWTVKQNKEYSSDISSCTYQSFEVMIFFRVLVWRCCSSPVISPNEFLFLTFFFLFLKIVEFICLFVVYITFTKKMSFCYSALNV